ncbi:hypothetical protein BELL_0829g00030 [Botrytis elliptica]|uniref:Uncharacterized protein n=1 Tax=Botrytis elliptica TaxID=278938 RepID=A0A4Z1JAE8_9HELO|nr:hypothetical protein EAE99_002074 [Botrytis elliptica]TGO68442.1 hypothetical protein BELL_0829g00030 [Botrytis elliptica]
MSMWDYMHLPPYEDGVPSFSLSGEEVAFLRQKQIILGNEFGGQWKINPGFLSMSYCEKQKEVPEGSMRAKKGSIQSFVIIVPVDASALPPIILPESTLCMAALLNIGWTNEAAGKIFDSWKENSRPRKLMACDDRDPTLIDYAISIVQTRMDQLAIAKQTKVDARKEMTILGLSTKFQDAMLDQDSDLLGGHVNRMDLCFWIIDALGKRYRNLVLSLRYLKNYAATGTKAMNW